MQPYFVSTSYDPQRAHVPPFVHPLPNQPYASVQVPATRTFPPMAAVPKDFTPSTVRVPALAPMAPPASSRPRAASLPVTSVMTKPTIPPTTAFEWEDPSALHRKHYRFTDEEATEETLRRLTPGTMLVRRIKTADSQMATAPPSVATVQQPKPPPGQTKTKAAQGGILGMVLGMLTGIIMLLLSLIRGSKKGKTKTAIAPSAKTSAEAPRAIHQVLATQTTLNHVFTGSDMLTRPGVFTCDFKCGFRGSYALVALHESKCVFNPKNSALHICDFNCGVSGSFDEVAAHELICALNPRLSGAHPVPTIRPYANVTRMAVLVEEPPTLQAPSLPPSPAEMATVPPRPAPPLAPVVAPASAPPSSELAPLASPVAPPQMVTGVRAPIQGIGEASPDFRVGPMAGRCI